MSSCDFLHFFSAAERVSEVLSEETRLKRMSITSMGMVADNRNIKINERGYRNNMEVK